MGNFHPYTKPEINESIILFWITAFSFVLSALIGWGIKHINIQSFPSLIKLLFAGYPIAIFEFTYWLFNKCLWKLFYKELSIEGTYEGFFQSSYDNFKKKYPVKIEIFQKFNGISISWEVPGSSKSWSINASLEKSSPKSVRLIYTYRNEPTEGTVNSPTQNIHYGTAILYFKNRKINGKYFTSERPILNSTIQRSNWGTIQAEKIS
jgi:hypothetical protein